MLLLSNMDYLCLDYSVLHCLWMNYSLWVLSLVQFLYWALPFLVLARHRLLRCHSRSRSQLKLLIYDEIDELV